MNLPFQKMKDCVWPRPEAVVQIEFLEWACLYFKRRFELLTNI